MVAERDTLVYTTAQQKPKMTHPQSFPLLDEAPRAASRGAASTSQSPQANNCKRNRLQELKTSSCTKKVLIGIAVGILLIVVITIAVSITQFNDRIAEVFVRPDYGELPHYKNYPQQETEQRYGSSYGVQPQYGQGIQRNGFENANNGLYQGGVGGISQQRYGDNYNSGQLQTGLYGNPSNYELQQQQIYPSNQGYGRRRR